MVIFCPHCQQKYRASEDMDGKVINCSYCGKSFQILAESDSAPAAPKSAPVQTHIVRAKSSKTMPCPDCSEIVSRRATVCPHCGAPLIEKKPVKRPAFCWVLNIFGLLILIFGAFMSFQSIMAENFITLEVSIVAIGIALLMITGSSMIAKRYR